MVFQPQYHQIDEIFLRQIIFNKDIDDSFVTLFGACRNPFNDSFIDVDYGCDFSLLTDLLLCANEMGEVVINLIFEKLINDVSEIPCIVDIENVFGNLLKIDKIILTIYKPVEENENGDLEIVKDEFYFIDSIIEKC